MIWLLCTSFVFFWIFHNEIIIWLISSDRRTHPGYGPLFQAHVQAQAQAPAQAQARSPGGAGRRAQAVESPHRRAMSNAQQEAVNRQADRLARVNIGGSTPGSARGGRDTQAPRATFEALMQGGGGVSIILFKLRHYSSFSKNGGL